MVLAATNRPSELDEAIFRRFSQAFEIGIPDRKERAAILKVTLKGERVDANINYDYLATLCEGCTGSDLVDLCKKAAYLPIEELLDAEKSGKPYQAHRPLTQTDLETVLLTSRKTTAAARKYSRPISKRDGEGYPVQNAISELSKLVVSQILNLQAENQDN